MYFSEQIRVEIIKNLDMGIFSFFNKEKKETLDKGLSKTKENVFSKITRAIAGKSRVDDDVLDNLEEVLITSDVGVETTLKIINRIQDRVAKDKYVTTQELTSLLREEIAALLTENNTEDNESFSLPEDKKPYVIMRDEVPGIHIRTTLMVGHPGETEEDFEQLLQFVQDERFERMGAFAYSHEEGTYSFKNYKDNISPEIKQQRLDALMNLQESISADVNASKIDKNLKVIIDREEDDFYVGRSEYDSPEVDPEILISKEQPLMVGQFYTVRITDSQAFDLYGAVVK